jgi:hypothetical protein
MAMLVLYGTLLAIVWALAVQSEPRLYIFFLGALIGVQSAAHIRHLRNYVLFRRIVANDGIKGRIEYSRPLMLRLSAIELVAFGVMFGALAGLTMSWFLAGAAVSCLSLGWKHFTLARKQAATVQEKVNAVSAG